MSDTNDLTEQLPTVPDTDGCAPLVDDDNDMTPLMQQASELAAIKLTCVNKISGVSAWCSVKTGSLITWLLEVMEGDSTKNMAELSLAGDEAESGSNVSDGSTVCNFVGVSFAQQPAAPEDHRSSGAAGSTKMRMLWLSESDFTKKLKEPSLEEDEAENGYQKDTQEKNMTKASNANGALYCVPLNLREVYRKRPLQFVLFLKQSRRSARLFVSIQKLVLSRI